MVQTFDLLLATDDERRRILEAHGMSEAEFNESVEILREWVRKSEDLPDYFLEHKNHLQVALLNAKMSIEKAKRTIEGYLTVKVVQEDFSKKLVPKGRYELVRSLSKNVVMPKLLPDLCRLQIAKITDLSGEAEDGLDYYIPGLMIAEMRLCHDFFLSNELLVDMEFHTLKTISKFTPSVNLKLVYILKAVNLRMHKIHLVNTTPVLDSALFVLKKFLPASLVDKILIHSSFESLHQHIPKEYLPSDYGGTEPSVEYLGEKWHQELVANEALLKEFTELKIKSMSRNHHDTLEELGLGSDGSFKRLTID